MMNEMMDNMMNEEVIEATAEEIVAAVDPKNFVKGVGVGAAASVLVALGYKYIVKPSLAKLKKVKDERANESDVLESEIVHDAEGEVVK